MTFTRTSDLADLLPITCIRPDGLVVLDDGTLLRGTRLDTAIAPLRMSDDEMERTNRSIQEMPAVLPDHQALQLITTARPFDWAAELDANQAGNDHLHRALTHDGQHERAEGLRRLALTGGQAIVQQSDRLSAMTLEHLLILPHKPGRGAGRNRQYSADTFHEAVEDLDARYDRTVTHLDTLQLEPRKLDGLEILHALYRTLNPGDQPPPMLDGLLGGPYTDQDEAIDHAENLRELLCRTPVDRSERTYLEMAGHVIQSRALSSTPDSTWLGWLLHLTQSPYPFTLSVRWQAGSRHRERSKAKMRYKRIYGLARGREMKLRPVDFEERQREAEAEALTAELSTTAGAGVYRVSVNLSISSPPDPTFKPRSEEQEDEDIAHRAQQLDRYMRSLEQEILTRTDARLHLPWFAHTDAWRATWPIALDPLGINRRYVTQNLADTIPLVSAHCGSPDGIPLGWERPGRTLAKLNPYDPRHDNHVMIVAAKSGSGKTMVTNLILGRILPHGATGAVIDRAGHYETLAKLVPGAVALNLGSRPNEQLDAETDPWKMPAHERPPAINPWDVTNPKHLPTEKLQYLIALHSFFLGTPTADGTFDLSSTEESLLSWAIRQVYQRCAKTREVPRETLLQAVLKVEAAREHEDGNHETGSILRRLADGLYDYVGDGSRAYLADWPTSIPDDAPLVIFDTRHVGDSDAGAAMFTIVEYLARQSELEKGREHRGPWAGRRFLVIDEGWKMLERKSTGRWINEQARRSRHNRLFLIAISQSITDFTKNAEGAALVSQSSIQLFLRQQPEQAQHIQDILKLTDLERDTIANLKTVKGQYSEAYFINGNRGSGLIEIRAGDAEYWYATSEPDHDQPLRNRVLEQHDGDVWAALTDLADNHAPLAA